MIETTSFWHDAAPNIGQHRRKAVQLSLPFGAPPPPGGVRGDPGVLGVVQGAPTNLARVQCQEATRSGQPARLRDHHRCRADLQEACPTARRDLVCGPGAPSHPLVLVKVVVRPDRFEIRDTAAVSTSTLAEKYAFRLGRAEDFPGSPQAVGQFGVGMKRALFKLGTRFEVRSVTGVSGFILPVCGTIDMAFLNQEHQALDPGRVDPGNLAS